MTKPDVLISFQNVSKVYDNKPVLNHFSLDIHRGEFITVIGTSGCGKTTALKMINGLLTPTSGKMIVDGEDISQTDVILLRRKIGYVIQSIGLFPHLTIEKNIGYVLNLQHVPKDQIKKRVGELIQLIGLPQTVLDRYPSELSGGQNQRVGIARALASHPEIMLMDEPFGAVDEITRRKLQEEFKRLQQEMRTTVFFITHDIQEALMLGTRVLVMDQGQMIQIGTPDEILQKPKTDFVAQLTKHQLSSKSHIF